MWKWFSLWANRLGKCWLNPYASCWQLHAVTVWKYSCHIKQFSFLSITSASSKQFNFQNPTKALVGWNHAQCIFSGDIVINNQTNFVWPVGWKVMNFRRFSTWRAGTTSVTLMNSFSFSLQKALQVARSPVYCFFNRAYIRSALSQLWPVWALSANPAFLKKKKTFRNPFDPWYVFVFSGSLRRWRVWWTFITTRWIHKTALLK